MLKEFVERCRSAAAFLVLQGMGEHDFVSLT